MYDNWLFLTLFLFPPKKREEEKENEVAKPVLNNFFYGTNRISPSFSVIYYYVSNLLKFKQQIFVICGRTCILNNERMFRNVI